MVAADIYAVEPHTGRGGWTWYTGSAGWMYWLLVDTLLGMILEGDQLRLAPHLPNAWDSFIVHYRYRQTVYHITIRRISGASDATNLLTLDGQEIHGTTLPLSDDHREHYADLRVRGRV